MPLDLFLDVEFLDPKPVSDRQWIGGSQVKEIGVQVEGIGQAVVPDRYSSRACDRLVGQVSRQWRPLGWSSLLRPFP